MKELDVAFTLVLASPDEVNELNREAGNTNQAVSFTDTTANKIYLSWPPTEKGTPEYEYGMDRRVLLHALGYEMTNLLHLDTDPLGR